MHELFQGKTFRGCQLLRPFQQILWKSYFSVHDSPPIVLKNWPGKSRNEAPRFDLSAATKTPVSMTIPCIDYANADKSEIGLPGKTRPGRMTRA
jgi:hypothetical protein